MGTNRILLRCGAGLTAVLVALSVQSARLESMAAVVDAGRDGEPSAEPRARTLSPAPVEVRRGVPPSSVERSATIERESTPLAVASGRSVRVEVRDVAGRPQGGIALGVDLEHAEGHWLRVRSGRTDASGRALFEGIGPGRSLRVAASFAGAPAPMDVPASGSVELVLGPVGSALVELRSAGGHALAGARRVEFREHGRPPSTGVPLTRTGVASRWSTPVLGPVHGVLHVDDSLGRHWSASVSLSPNATSAAVPDPRWLTIAGAAPAPRRPAEVVGPGRLRWSLRFGERPTRRGSTPLSGDGGFHAVVDRRTARAQGGRLELCWGEGADERELLAWWYPDPLLDHVPLGSTRVGEPDITSRKEPEAR